MQHPSADLIERFAQGRLPLAEAARWEQHFSSCEACGQKLCDVGPDGFMQMLKQTAAVDIDPTQAHQLFPELPAEMRTHSRYTIQKKLGHGGMGMVYHATHKLMHRQVALKMIRHDLLATPLAVTRFRREVQAAASLDHPNIVRAFDAEEIEGVHFLVMEYVEGKSLDQLVQQKGTLTPSQTIGIARQIAQGLQHAHSLGMIHRNIKPNNVMITRQSKVKILDFGLARWLGHADEKTLPSITQTGSHLGTLMYAAPEQLQSAAEVDARADLYSLGATMAYLLNGEPPPFILDKAAEPLTFADDVPAGLQQIIRTLLSRQAIDRFTSAKEVIDELAQQSSTVLPVAPPSVKGLRYALLAACTLVVILMAMLMENAWRSSKDIAQATTTVTTRPVSQNPVQQNLVPTSPVQTSPPQQNPIQPTVPARTPPAETVHQPQVPRADTAWQSILSRIQPERDAVAGSWRTIPEGLAVAAHTGARLMLPIEVPAAYDVRISFTRRTGRHSIGILLVQGNHACTCEVDAWGEHLAGFQNIDGQNIKANASRQEGYALKNNQKYTLLVEVRPGSLKAYLDDQPLCSYEGESSRLSIGTNYWALPKQRTLALLAWESATVFHDVEWRAR